MNPLIATVVYAIGVAVLFYLDRDRTVRTSGALWLPVVYLWVLGSRPVSFWLGMSPANPDPATLNESPLDGAFFAALLVAGLWVLFQRKDRVFSFLGASWPILVYFFYCLLSVLWSDYPGVASKRWIKAIGDLVMVLIVLTEKQPVAALGRLFSRRLHPGALFYPVRQVLSISRPRVRPVYGSADVQRLGY